MNVCDHVQCCDSSKTCTAMKGPGGNITVFSESQCAVGTVLRTPLPNVACADQARGCVSNECCVSARTCQDTDGDGDGKTFAEWRHWLCPSGWTRLNPLPKVKCAGLTCEVSDCCKSVRTCADTDSGRLGFHVPFKPDNCTASHKLKSPLPNLECAYVNGTPAPCSSTHCCRAPAPAPQLRTFPTENTDFFGTHVGHCSSGWIRKTNFQNMSLTQCASNCFRYKVCAFFSFNPFERKCSLYRNESCPTDHRYPAYMSYAIVRGTRSHPF